MWGAWVLVYFAAAMAGHAVACRLPLSGNIVAKFLAVGSILGLIMGGHMVLVSGVAFESLTALLVYAFVCEVYIFLFTLVISSVSASLLVTLNGGGLTDAEIDRRYSNTSMVERRIEQLLAVDLLGMSASGYMLTARGRQLSSMCESLRRFFRHAK